jgi:hypothetical protein
MHKRLAVLFLLLTLSLIGFCHAEDWKTIVTYSKDNQASATFHVSTNEWRIVWNYTVSNWVENSSMFGLMVFRDGQTSNPMILFSNVKESDPRNGIIYSHSYAQGGAGDYDISIIGQLVDDYTVTIEYDASSLSPSPSIPEIPVLGVIVMLFAFSLVTIYNRKTMLGQK